MPAVEKNKEFTILDFTKVLGNVLKNISAKISLIEDLPGEVNRVFITNTNTESFPEEEITGNYFRLFYVSGSETFYLGFCCRCSVIEKQRVYFSSLTKNGIKLMSEDIRIWLSNPG